MENFHTHDRGYKYLFSNPLLLKELLESFVDMEWVKQIDFTKAENINTSFVSDEFKNRESDIIYRLTLQDTDLYLYLLIEFQSTVDRFMAMRMLRYTLELYDYLIKNHKCRVLPVIFPLMLYNGEAKWTAPEDISHLIDIPNNLNILKKYVPHFQYFCIIENRYSEESLMNLGNIVSSIFLLENRDKEKLLSTIEAVKKSLDGEDISIIKTFLVWLKQYLKKNSTIDEAQQGIRQITSPMEAQTMFAKTIEEVKQDIFQEGIQQGIAKGLQEGIEKKAIETARNMLNEGIDIDIIERVTGLERERILKLKGE